MNDNIRFSVDILVDPEETEHQIYSVSLVPTYCVWSRERNEMSLL